MLGIRKAIRQVSRKEISLRGQETRRMESRRITSKQTHHVNLCLFSVLKYQSAYAQNQFKQELCRYMDELTKKIGGQFEIFSTLQISIAADMDIVWR